MVNSSVQKINKEMFDLNYTLDQVYPTDVNRAFHPAGAEYIFFSNTRNMFSRINYVIGHKTTPSKFKKTEIILRIFSNHNCIKLEVNNKRKPGKVPICEN